MNLLAEEMLFVSYAIDMFNTFKAEERADKTYYFTVSKLIRLV